VFLVQKIQKEKFMPKKLAISTGALLLLLGSIAPAYAQRDQGEPEKKEEGKPQQGEQRQQAKPAPPQRQEAKPAEQKPQAAKPAPRPQQAYGGSYHAGVRPSEPTNGGVHPSGVPQHAGQVRSGFTQSRAKSWNTDHKTWAQRGGYNGYRIPDDRFKLYFGANHFFQIGRLPLLFVGGFPRFQYDGYWVTFVDPWPDTWPPTWYETDDCYLDYSDGYYLYDRNYPGIGIAVTVSF
jgi:hypothetical protein